MASLPKFQFTMGLHAQVGITPTMYVNVWKVTNVEIVDAGSGIQSSAFVQLENLSTVYHAPGAGGSAELGYPNNFNFRRPIIGETSLSHLTGTGRNQGVFSNSSKNATFNITVNPSTQTVSGISLQNGGFYYGIGQATQGVSTDWRSWVGNSTGNLNTTLSSDGGYFVGLPAELKINDREYKDVSGNRSRFSNWQYVNDIFTYNFLDKAATGKITRGVAEHQNRNRQTVGGYTFTADYNLSTATVSADAGSATTEGIIEARFNSPSATVYGITAPVLGLTSSSKNSMFSQPSTPTPDPDKGLKIYELPEINAEEFDKTDNFVIVQKPDGQLFKMDAFPFSAVQGVDGIEFFDKEIIFEQVTLSGQAENYDIPAHDLSGFVPDSANFAIITIEVGGGNYPYVSATIGGCFTYKVSRGTGRNTPKSSQIFAPLVNGRLLITNVEARATGSLIIRLHGYG